MGKLLDQVDGFLRWLLADPGRVLALCWLVTVGAWVWLLVTQPGR